MGELAQGLWERLAGRYTPARPPGRAGTAVARFQQVFPPHEHPDPTS